MVLDKLSGRLKVFRRKARIGSISCLRISPFNSTFRKFGGNSDGKHHPSA
jgi:hypothetical protein